MYKCSDYRGGGGGEGGGGEKLKAKI
jgi:hypothetical protein